MAKQKADAAKGEQKDEGVKADAKGIDTHASANYAASRDTATLEKPDSGRNQRVMMGGTTTAPFDIAPREALTPSATTFERNDTDDSDTVVGMAVSRERRDGTVVVDAECPDHGGDVEVVAGTLGKTATCHCGALLVAKEYVEDGTGATIERDKDGTVSLKEPKGVREAAKDEGRGAGPAQRFVTREDSIKERAKESKVEARKAGSRRKNGTRKSTAKKSTKASKAEAAAEAK